MFIIKWFKDIKAIDMLLLLKICDGLKGLKKVLRELNPSGYPVMGGSYHKHCFS